LRVRESNSANAAYETAVMLQLNLPAFELWSSAVESNHVEPPYQDGAQPESMRWKKIEHLLRIELSHQPYRSCAPPSTHQVPNGASQRTRTALSCLRNRHVAVYVCKAHLWSGIRESNPAGLFGRQVPEAIGQSRSLQNY
jgi:hypothetical protein